MRMTVVCHSSVTQTRAPMSERSYWGQSIHAWPERGMYVCFTSMLYRLIVTPSPNWCTFEVSFIMPIWASTIRSVCAFRFFFFALTFAVFDLALCFVWLGHGDTEVLVDSRQDMGDWMEGPENNPFGVSATLLHLSPCSFLMNFDFVHDQFGLWMHDWESSLIVLINNKIYGFVLGVKTEKEKEKKMCSDTGTYWTW